ncbi:uncharacterized protein BXZ73DRAFT_87896 [Epithele typhae]|uniref:uncharacterized protein n=1 Tax=Epithele typhae TaxID=378194 RepID=UPI002008B011|nr:uncharacterized protein BXZ73DRAFT_87896 [Epithele typhae]KAH9942229.1 hypothetical protein BXZ73DRAFT_87896 [Epithele typhae]
MGVHGLTTYLRENNHLLSRSLSLPLSQPGPNTVSLVVDAWSFIYEVIHCADLPWVYGGEYTRLESLVGDVVRAWLAVGLELHFVFDGPYPELKFPTVLSRMTHTNIQAGLIFFRTSPTARSQPRFLRETAMLPPLAYSVCVDALLRLASSSSPPPSDSPAHRARLFVHFADEEGDPYAVALAARLGGYVAGKDSDFVVLNAEGYLGYVPLDEIVWTATVATPDMEGSVYAASSVADTEYAEDDDGFQVVKKGKKGKSKVRKPSTAPDGPTTIVAGRGILPPSALPASSSDLGPIDPAQLSLTIYVYAPATLATHLSIPVSLLPLLGALLGNDFTAGPTPSPGDDSPAPSPATTAEIRSRGRANNLQRLFFNRQLTLPQRISRVASTLSGLLASAVGTVGAGARKRGRKIGSVMELIDAAVAALLVRPLDTFATGEREAVVERIAEATLQYAIPRPTDDGGDAGAAGGWASAACALHAVEACPLVAGLSRVVNARAEEREEGGRGRCAANAGADWSQTIRTRYVEAYRAGRLDPHALDAVVSGTSWPRMFLEDPDKETVTRSVGRPLRRWMWAVLDAGVGLPVPPPVQENEEDEAHEDDDEEDEDELIDVEEGESEEEEDEEGEDPLARLRGALQDLDGEGQASLCRTNKPFGQDKQNHTRANGSSIRRPTKVITEYVRRGTRMAPEEVTASSLDALLQETPLGPPIHVPSEPDGTSPPPQLWPRDARLAVFRAAAGETATTALEGVDDGDLLAVLGVRYVVRLMDARARENPVKERIQERWTEAEARAVLTCLTSSAELDEGAGEDGAERVEVKERHVQLVVQTQTALDALEQLAQVLLLDERKVMVAPGRVFSGARCHAILGGRAAVGAVREEVWTACKSGLGGAFAPPPQKRAKDKKKAVNPGVQEKPRGKPAGKAGLFAMLGDASA